VLLRRWVVERSIAWVGRYRRLSKDYEYPTAEQRDDDLRGTESIDAAMARVQRSVRGGEHTAIEVIALSYYFLNSL
jgi:transposase